MARASARKLISYALILSGILLAAGYRYWLGSRTFVALDAPVSVAHGHINTGEFHINLRELYFIRVDLDDPPQSCLLESDPALTTQFTLFRDGQVLGKMNGHFRHYYGGYFDSIGSFDADKEELYNIDIKVLSGSNCFSGRPRIAIVALSDCYYELHYAELFLSGILILSGLGLLNHAAVAEFGKRLTGRDNLVIFESTRRGYHRTLIKPLPRPFSGLPSFGLIYSTIVSLVLIIVLFQYSSIPRRKGIWLSLPTHSAHAGKAELSPRQVIIRLEGGADAPMRIFLNSRLVVAEKLSGALQVEIESRSDRIVYVQADPNLSWT